MINIYDKRTQVFLHVTTKCNLNCPYCWSMVYGKDKPREDMTQETAIQALKWIADNSEEDVIVTLFGGEPLTNWPLVKFILENYAANRYGLSTNGTLLTEEIVNTIVKSRNSMQISVSVDGTPDENKKTRGMAYDESLVRRAFTEMSYSTARIVCGHPERLYDDVMYLLGLGAKNISLNFRRHVLNSEDYYNEMDAQCARLWADTELRPRIFFPYVDTECRQCTIGTNDKKEVSIMPNGDLYVCNVGYWIDWGYIGNIFDGIRWPLLEQFNADKDKGAKDGVYSLCAVEQRAQCALTKKNWEGEKKYYTYREGKRVP